MNRDILEAPFSPDQLRQRQGNFGVLDYVEGHTVIQRLNDALDSAWSFEILEHHILHEQNEVLVLGRLSTTGVIKCQFGSSSITKAKQTGENVSLADDLKAAATDSLKKCASMLGVGLHLYGGAKKQVHPRQNDNVTPLRGARAENGDNQAPGRLSSKQHQYIIKLAQNRGRTKKELNDHCVKTYGAGVDFISKKHASALIEALRADNGPAQTELNQTRAITA
jgi:hypothetical protein